MPTDQNTQTTPAREEFFEVRYRTVEGLRDLVADVKSGRKPDASMAAKLRDLEKQLSEAKKAKRYGLVWEEEKHKEKFETDLERKLPVLQEVESLAVQQDPAAPQNLVIEGDNIHALAALSYTHKGKVDVIYIDPPYNTGNRDFIYNDDYVDREDAFRHSKWLSFMSKRLRTARDLLAETGVIFISIDDNEQAHLRMLCDEIFGEENFLNCVAIKTSESSGVKMSHVESKLPKIHEYVLIYGKSKNSILKPIEIEKIIDPIKFQKYLKYYGKFILNPEDPVEKWKIIKVIDAFKKFSAGVVNKPTIDQINKFKIKFSNRVVYRTNNKFLQELFFSSETKLVKSPTGIDYVWWQGKQMLFLSEYVKEGLCDLWTDISTINLNKENCGLSDFKNGQKPLVLLNRVLELSKQNKELTILDFFAGSGTTGHAVLELNKRDGGNRRFILVSSRENTKEDPDKNLCRDVTWERVRRVAEGYENSKGEDVPGLGGNLRYFKTAFVPLARSSDDRRAAFMDKCDDLLRIRESCFTPVKAKKIPASLRLYRGTGDRFLAVLYDPRRMADLRNACAALGGTVAAYVFSAAGEIDADALDGLPNATIQTVPDEILAAYRKIFRF